MRLLAALLMLVPMTAAAEPEQAVVSLPKVTKWEMNYDQDSCHLLAKFGQGDETVVIRITRFQPGSRFDLMLYGPMFRSVRTWETASVGFGDAAKVEDRLAGAGTTATKLPFLIVMKLRLDGGQNSEADEARPAVSEALEGQTKSIIVRLQKGKSYRLETGSLAAPFEAMRTCTNELVAKWGYDPAVLANLSKPVAPTGSPSSWATTADYPINSLRAGHSGLIQFRLDLDETGKVIGCHVLRHFKPDDFDALTCRLISKRAKFTPALDSAGKPVKSFYINTLRFVIPEE